MRFAKTVITFICAGLVAIPAWSVSPQSTPPTVQQKLPTVQQSAAELKRELDQTLKQYGTQTLSTFLRQQAEAGLNLGPLRQYFFKKNHGSVEVIDVRIPVNAQRMITFANQQLSLSGIDFIQFNGIVDPSLPPLTQPLPDQAAAYKEWVHARATIFPLMGFAVTLFEAGLGRLQASTGELAASLARAFTVLGLEVQFSAFSAQWNKLWVQDQSLIPWRFNEQTRDFAGTAHLLNRFLDSIRGVTRAHVWNYLVNWGYTLLLYGVGVVALRRFGVAPPGIAQMIRSSWVTNTGGYMAFGLTQVMLGKSFARGEISELLRYQLETLAVGWGGFWRAVATVPGLSSVGNTMLYSFGLLVTAPLFVKTYNASAYARKTGKLFEANSEAARHAIEQQNRTSDFYAVTPYSKEITSGSLLKQTYHNLIRFFCWRKRRCHLKQRLFNINTSL